MYYLQKNWVHVLGDLGGMLETDNFPRQIVDGL